MVNASEHAHQILFQAVHPTRRASEVRVVVPIWGEKAGTAPLAQVHTSRKRLGFNPVGLHGPSDRDLRFGNRHS